MKSTYGERDYGFGATMLTLRTAIGLTQAGLANLVGVSRRAVSEWEAGSSYPKAEHLKEVITLAVKYQAFSPENAAEEIRALWKASHQKVLLDELWLSALLSQRASPQRPALLLQPRVVPPAGEATLNITPITTHLAPGPWIDWGDSLALPTFYGRGQELALLAKWVLQEHCRVVSILGMGGIGKSVLAVSLMHQFSRHFEVVIFRSLRNTPPCEELLEECLQVLSPLSLGQSYAVSAGQAQVAGSVKGIRQAQVTKSAQGAIPTEGRIGLLLSLLREVRALIVLDNLESLMEPGDVRGRLRPGFEGYEQLLRRVAEVDHQSCLLLTSREKYAELRPLESKHSPVRSLRLTGLDTDACKQICVEKDVVGTSPEQEQLFAIYGGNPLALKMVTEIIVDLFAGQIGPFLTEDTIIFGNITDLLAEQFARLSALERCVLYWLAIVREPVTLNELLAMLAFPRPRSEVLEALDGLNRRSLIEPGQRLGSYTLQSVVLEYTTTTLIAEASREIQQGLLTLLIEYSLSQATAREYIRQTQERLLVTPLLADLQHAWLEQASKAIRGSNPVDEQLLTLLTQLRTMSDRAQGYGPANLITLLRVQRGHLSGLDLSHLSIREVYLQGVEMHDTSLVGTTLHDAVWTSAFDVIIAVATSPDEKLWAMGTQQGEVRVWCEGGQSLHLVWWAHTDIVWTLAFSPDGRTLATGSFDGTVKLWNLEHGTLLWMGQHTDIVASIAFAPDGRKLASCGADALIRFWDVTSGANIETFSGQGSVLWALAWSPDGKLLASGGFDGKIRLWHLQGTQPATCAAVLAGHTNWMMALAFSPNGKQLASGSWDGTVKLWEVETSHLLRTLVGHTARVYAVAWSEDGRVVASAGFDHTIWLWDVERSRYRAALHGHTALVYSVAFTPDSHSLISGSEDGTVRVWDIASGQCLRIIEGCAATLYDVAWSPDSTRLASAGTDTLVTIWDVTGGTQPKVLRGHSWHLFGVVWSPDGKLLASSGRDNAIRLWDPTTGECRQVLRDPDHADTMFYGAAWSPDGRLLASGSYLRGVQVWDMVTRTRCWIGQHPTRIRRVAWSPDGTRLAGSGDDGSVCLWEASDGTGQQLATVPTKLQGHSGRVMSVVWSPDGTRLASGGGEELFVWDSLTGELVQTFKGRPGSVFAVLWSPTGDVLLSGSSDGTICWWDVLTAECLRTCEGHKGGVWSLRVSPDGRLLASSGNDNSIRVWDLQSGEPLRTLRHNRPYERLNITGIEGLNEAQKTSLQALGAVEDSSS